MSIPDGVKLLNYNFNNGYASCAATVYDLCPILKKLGLLSHDIDSSIICWIRNYKTGKPINDTNSLLYSIDNKHEVGLRISFFSSVEIKRVTDLPIYINAGFLPVIDNSGKTIMPKFKVYTLWWMNNPHITLSGINKYDVNIIDMFYCINDAYREHYMCFDESDETDEIDERRFLMTSGIWDVSDVQPYKL